MTTYSRPKNVCATCGKTAGMFSCRGCSKSFCLQHTNDHRRALEKQMQELIVSHNVVNDSMNIDSINENYRHLKDQIHRWEEQSVEKIRHTAEELRQELDQIIEQQQKVCLEKLTPLTDQLSVSRENGDFFEQDLTNWTEKLNTLRQDLVEYQKIRLEQSKPLIARLIINKTISPQQPVIYKLQRSEGIYQRSFSRDSKTNLTMNGEYSIGDHLFRFKIESFKVNSLLLIGIVSVNSSDEINPQENPTFYGWGSNNWVYHHGIGREDSEIYRSDIEKDDTFQLTLDCQEYVIRLANERTHSVQEIVVDIEQCPFPWKPHVRLLHDSY